MPHDDCGTIAGEEVREGMRGRLPESKVRQMIRLARERERERGAADGAREARHR